jgi:shikimate kinase
LRSSADAEAPLASLVGVRRILVTGMSGTGKSSALAELGNLGFDVVDTDLDGWTEWSDRDGGNVWREDRVRNLLARETGPSLFVSGTVSNQGSLYDRFHAIVLLSAPADVLLSRLETRTTSPYGKRAEARRLVLRHLAEVEPLLRKRCTHEIDATRPLFDVVAQLAELGRPAAP